jgi:hypothetical protein
MRENSLGPCIFSLRALNSGWAFSILAVKSALNIFISSLRDVFLTGFHSKLETQPVNRPKSSNFFYLKTKIKHEVVSIGGGGLYNMSLRRRLI